MLSIIAFEKFTVYFLNKHISQCLFRMSAWHTVVVPKCYFDFKVNLLSATAIVLLHGRKETKVYGTH